MTQRLAILNVVGLAPHHRADMPHLARFQWRPLRPSFPAVTCSVQATLLTGQPPAEHGVVANGFYDRDTCEVKFWEQPGSLVQRPRLWDLLPGRKTAVICWQNTMYINADTVITPRPLHLEHKFIQWCYSKPAGYYESLIPAIGSFKLQSYWGPLAGIGSSQWIARAARETWRRREPDLMLVYLPHLDYSSQKFGPASPQARQAVREIDEVVGELLAGLGDAEVIVCSEYSLTPVNGAICPNRQLRAAGLLRVREIAGREFLDYELSDAFAMVDHQVAHIYCKPHALAAARAALPGCEFTNISHPRAGELVAIAPADKWFAYYWWTDWAKAPDFAYFVDIHRKPGYDPCELWFDWKRMARTLHPATATNPELVRGSHGRPDSPAVFLTSERLGAHLPATVDATALAPMVCRALGSA